MRKVCVYTSTRAEYGLLRRLMYAIQRQDGLHLQLLVSGTHLSPEFGYTVSEIEADGFTPDECVEIVLSADTPTGICKSMGLALAGYGDALKRLDPSILVILGDRYEAFCCAAAAQVCRIPIAHLHGGETTEGAIDEAFRHSITKLSHLHFPCCEEYAKRLSQLGEQPAHVFNVGSLGVQNARNTSLLTREELGDAIGHSLALPYFLVTFHPATLEDVSATEQFRQVLNALSRFPKNGVVFTKANADAEGRGLNDMIDKAVAEQPLSCIASSSLGRLRYLSAMKHCIAVVGNSSSGIIEAPTFGVPTVNVGDRQKGRVRALSVIDCEATEGKVAEAMGLAMDASFRASLESMANPYYQDDTAGQIVKVLQSFELNDVLKKRFNDAVV